MAKIIQVKVTTKAKESRIIEDFEGNLKVRVKSLPVEGRANEELIKLLSNYYKVTKQQVEIVRGKTNRHKIIKIVE